RPQPKMASARRALPAQYFSVISAWKARRVAPVICEAARRKSAICGGVGDMETGGVEPNLSMQYPHAEDGWPNKRKPHSNPSTPHCLGKIFSRYGLRCLALCGLEVGRHWPLHAVWIHTPRSLLRGVCIVGDRDSQ